MAATPVDLYLGSDIGAWALERVEAGQVRQVVTPSDEIARAALDRGIPAWQADPHDPGFRPSEVGFSVHYPRLLRPPLLGRYERVYNLHPGYLPWGRGYFPIFWALWEGSPAGATLHEMSAGLDEGPVVAQARVEQFEHDTGGSLFARVREAEMALFLEYWPRLAAGERPPARPQAAGGTYHARKEFERLKRGDDWQSLDAARLLRLVRCLTFPGFTGLEVTLGGRPFELRLAPLTDEAAG
jgi:methionyl-tRNA formyltransferase